jgi:phage gpG-like protein
MAVTTLNVKVVDHGWEAVKERIDALRGGGATVSIGVQGAQAAANHQGTHLTVAQLATVHEFGKVIRQPNMNRTIVIPERSFLRATVDRYREAIARRQVLLTQGYVLGKFELQGAMELLGQYVVGLVKQRIANGIAPPNAPSTIARKGSSKPLIDTGQLRNSITYKVEVGSIQRGEYREGA